jgi:hypothetical protein
MRLTLQEKLKERAPDEEAEEEAPADKIHVSDVRRAQAPPAPWLQAPAG